MIFTFEHYNDLGRCSYATLKESFDSEKDEIYLNEQKVEIKEIQDLFPFLWQSPGIAFHSNGKSKAYFYSEGTHWHHDYDKSIVRCENDIKKLQDKLKRNPSSKRIDTWMNEIKTTSEHRQSLINIQNRLDKEMEEQKLELIKENTKE